MRYARHIKGGAVSAIATAACHFTLSAGLAWARDQSSENPDSWSGLTEFGATVLASWLLMPLLLWAGMRGLGERHTYPLLILGTPLWAVLSLVYVDDIDRPAGHMPIPALIAFVVVCTLLGGVNSGRNKRVERCDW